MPAKTINDLYGDPEFAKLPRESQSAVLEALKPGFNALEPTTQDNVLMGITGQKATAPVKRTSEGALAGEVEKSPRQFKQVTSEPIKQLPEVSPKEGISNILRAVGGGITDVGSALISPDTYQHLGQAITGGLERESETFQQQGPLQYALETLPAFGSGELMAIRQLGQGLYNLPGDIQNVYFGQDVVPRTEFPQLPFDVRAQAIRRPATAFVGEQAPYAIPVAHAARAKLLPAIIEGTAIGAVLDPGQGGLRARAGQAAMGGAIPTALGGGGRALSALARRAKTVPIKRIPDPDLPVGIQQLREPVQPPIDVSAVDELVKELDVFPGKTYKRELPVKGKRLKEVKDAKALREDAETIQAKGPKQKPATAEKQAPKVKRKETPKPQKGKAQKEATTGEVGSKRELLKELQEVQQRRGDISDPLVIREERSKRITELKEELGEAEWQQTKRKFKGPDFIHRSYVEEAVSKGKPVPEEVLKDYPDLQPKEKASTRQAEEAQKIRKARVKYEQAGFVGKGKDVKKKMGVPDPEGKSHSIKKQFKDKSLVGATRQKPGMLDKIKQSFEESFSYMPKIRNKTFDVGGKQVEGNYLVGLVDRLQSRLKRGYSDASLKIENAIEHLEDSKGYSAQEKLDDVTEYLLHADYIRRAQEGQPIPGGIPYDELSKGFKKVSKHVRENPDVRKAVLNFRGLLNEIGKEMVDQGILPKQRRQYYPHQVLEYIHDRYGLPVKMQRFRPGFTKAAKGSEKAIETDILIALDTHLKAVERMRAIDDFIDKTVDTYAEKGWKLGDEVPKGFKEWQPRSGRIHYQALTVPELRVFEKSFQEALQTTDGLAKELLEKARTALVVGRPRKTFVMPEDIVNFLDKIYDPVTTEGVDQIAVNVVRYWKRIVTNSPLNPGVYAFNLKNTIGDIENVFRDDPSFASFVERARREIIEARKGDPSKDFLDAQEWGTIGAGYYGSEIELAQGSFNMKRRFGKGLKEKLLYQAPVMDQISKFYQKWEKYVEKGDLRLPTGFMGEAREDWMRYTKFLADRAKGLEPWQAHIESGRTFINYNHLTPFEKTQLRDFWLPFYTFYKGNAIYWGQALTGQRGKGPLMRGWGLALALPQAAAIWNYMTDPDYGEFQDRESKRYLTNQVHVYTGQKDDRGRPIYFILPLASNQAMQLFGLGKLPTRLATMAHEAMEGKRPFTDILKKQITKALGEDLTVPVGKGEGVNVPRPLAETLELINPFLKEITQQLFDYDLFLGRQITRPGVHVSKGENIKRRARHLLNVMVPPTQRLSKAFSTTIDPNVKVLDIVTGMVKAPDIHSWSDFIRESKKLEAENRKIKDRGLRALREEVTQSQYEEMKTIIYDTQIKDKRYAKVLSTEQTERVQTLLRTTKQGNGMTYSANSKYGLLTLIKAMDNAYEDERLPKEHKAKLKRVGEPLLRRYAEAMNKNGEARIKAAIQAVKSTNDKELQSKRFKGLTKRLEVPPEVAKDIKALGNTMKHFKKTGMHSETELIPDKEIKISR